MLSFQGVGVRDNVSGQENNVSSPATSVGLSSNKRDMLQNFPEQDAAVCLKA